MSERHIGLMTIGEHEFMDLLRLLDGTSIVKLTGVPEDGTIMGASYDPRRASFVVRIEGPTMPLVYPGEEIPSVGSVWIESVRKVIPEDTLTTASTNLDATRAAVEPSGVRWFVYQKCDKCSQFLDVGESPVSHRVYGTICQACWRSVAEDVEPRIIEAKE